MKRALAVLAAIAVVMAIAASLRGRGVRPPKLAAGGARSTQGWWRATLPRAPTAPREVATGEVNGTVRDAAGGVIAGALVCAAGEPMAMVRDDLEARCAPTDSDGRYRLLGLEAAHYQLGAAAPTFVPGRWTGPGPDHDRWLWLAAGTRRDGLDIVLGTGGARVRGAVRDVDGIAIADARVEVAGLEIGDGPAAVTWSASDGSFEVWTTPGMLSASAVRDSYTRAEARTVAPTEGLVLYVLPGSALSGTVLDGSTGRPVAHARVHAVEAQQPLYGRSALAGDDGTFHITGLAPGRYDVHAETAGAWGEASDSVTLGLGQTADEVAVTLHAAGAVNGRIVVDDGTAPRRGCGHGSVTLVQGTRTQQAWSDADGNVWFDAVPPGEYRILVDCDGFPADEDRPTLEVDRDGVLGLEWIVDGAGQRTGADRDAGDASMADRGAIDGVVVDDHGLPVPAAFVRATGEPTEEVGDDRRAASAPAHATTRDDGTFRLASLRAGRYRLSASGPGRRARARDAGAPVDVRAGETANVRVEVVRETGVIAGVVIDGAGGPLAGALVTAVREGAGEHPPSMVDVARRIASLPPGTLRPPVVSDAAGRFRLDELADGRYTLHTFRRGGGEAFAEHVPVGTTDARVVLARR